MNQNGVISYPFGSKWMHILCGFPDKCKLLEALITIKMNCLEDPTSYINLLFYCKISTIISQSVKYEHTMGRLGGDTTLEAFFMFSDIFSSYFHFFFHLNLLQRSKKFRHFIQLQWLLLLWDLCAFF